MTQRAEGRGRLLHWTLLAYSALVLILSLYPNPRELLPPGWSLTDTALHFTGYMPLGMLIALALPPAKCDSPARLRLTAVAAVTVGAFYGAAIEVGQAFVGRSADLRDAAVNVAAVGIGVLAVTAGRIIRRS